MDVRIEGDRIASVRPSGAVSPGVRGADVEVECGGGALLPGLHDHHVHLLSMEAALASLDVSSGLDARIARRPCRDAPGRRPPCRALRRGHRGAVGPPAARRPRSGPCRCGSSTARARCGSSARPPWPRSVSSVGTGSPWGSRTPVPRWRAWRPTRRAFPPDACSASMPGCGESSAEREGRRPGCRRTSPGLLRRHRRDRLHPDADDRLLRHAGRSGTQRGPAPDRGDHGGSRAHGRAGTTAVAPRTGEDRHRRPSAPVLRRARGVVHARPTGPDGRWPCTA